MKTVVALRRVKRSRAYRFDVNGLMAHSGGAQFVIRYVTGSGGPQWTEGATTVRASSRLFRYRKSRSTGPFSTRFVAHSHGRVR